MSLAPRSKSAHRASLFSDTGEQTARLSLFQAVFFDRTKSALDIIKTDADQINLQEPFADLTSLHLAIFRQNLSVVRNICEHPVTQIDLKDRFGRKAIDMCVYTSNEDIFHAVLERTYQGPLLQLDRGDDSGVVPFRPDQ